MNIEMKNGGVIFNIQRFSMHDGPGIRTTVFLKGCPLSCFWCQNPESQKKRPELFFQKDNCMACCACIPACPNKANTLLDVIISIDRDKCEGCGKCVELCLNDARTVVGRYVRVDEIMKEIMKDTKYYEKSGGGVTLSGGEPTAQPELALTLLQKCKAEGIHTAIETCGFASWPVFDRLLEYTDLVFLDIKCMDPERHRKATGMSNRLVLENAVKIARQRPLKIRVPLIPGFNDQPEEIRKTVEFVKENLGGCEIELLQYNRMGENKYERLGRPFVGLAPAQDDHFERLKEIVNCC